MGTINKNLLFYKIMEYPVPTESNLFLFEKKLDQSNKQDYKPNKQFSRKQKNKFMDRFIDKINKHGKLYKSLPFIQKIYLCNSITFNALKRDSDIDLFIIVKRGSMWRARLFSAILFKLSGLKRSIKNKKQKFCLSFYVTEDNTNLYPILIEKTDIYLSYRLAHLVPLYQDQNKSKQNSIYKNNKRFSTLMPNHPLDHCISIGNKVFTGKSKTKKIIEFTFGGIFGYIIEKIIKIIRLPILIKKTKKLGDKGKNIIINDNMLKFHDDIREKIQLIYQIAQKQ